MKKALMTAMMNSISDVMETMFFLPVEFDEELSFDQTKVSQETENLAAKIEFKGDFKKGDVLRVCDVDKQEIARGVSRYSSSELKLLSEKKGQKELIHCDDLVIRD